MTTNTLDRRTSALQKEVELLRSFVIGRIGKDMEGEYQPAFVRKVMKALSETPKYEFGNVTSFLKHIKGK